MNHNDEALFHYSKRFSPGLIDFSMIFNEDLLSQSGAKDEAHESFFRTYQAISLLTGLADHFGGTATLFSKHEGQPKRELAFPEEIAGVDLLHVTEAIEQLNQLKMSASFDILHFPKKKYVLVDEVQVKKKYKKIEPGKILLFRLPNLSSLQDLSPIPIDSEWLICLFDPLTFTSRRTNYSQHEAERKLLQAILTNWWVKMLFPKQNRIQMVTRPFSTLMELARDSIQEAMNVRRDQKDDSNKRFQFDSDGKPIDGEFLNRWTPRFPIKITDSELDAMRGTARTLLYFATWYDSHHDLERSRQVNHSTKVGDDDDKGTDPVERGLKERKTDGTADDKWTYPVERWIRERKDNPAGIVKWFDQLTSVIKENSKQQGERGYREIGRELLLGHLVGQWTNRESSLYRDIENEVLSDLELTRMMHGLAITLHFLYAERQMQGDLLHRMMQLMSKYCHDDLGIPARIDLRSHLLHAVRGEPALHSLKRFYRDHFFHVFEVCASGHVMLDTKLPDGSYLWQRVAKSMRLADRTDVLRQWYLAALLHDIGYAMDMLNSSRDHLSFFKHSDALRQLCESHAAASEKLSVAEELRCLNLPKRKAIPTDHGVVGAIHLASLLSHIAKEDKSVSVSSFKPAIEAIAYHNLRNSTDRISYNSNPIAVLLAICDQIQEWRRPRLPYSLSAQTIISRISGGAAYPPDSHDHFKKILANLQVESTGNQLQYSIVEREGSTALQIALRYGEEINRNSGVFQIWLDSTLNFQRLDLEGLPIDVIITFETPFYRRRISHDYLSYQSDKNVSVIPQLHRLRDAANETHMTFLRGWFPEKSIEKTLLGENRNCLTNGCLTYHAVEEERYEYLEFDLKALSKKTLITRDMDAFWKCMHEWRHYNEDRDFPGDYAAIVPE